MQQIHTLNCKGRLLSITGPIVMGILNATPDSFYNRGQKSQPEELLREAEKMLNDGAAILDIGGMSSRPGATEISSEEELDRVIPVISKIRNHFPDCYLSIDTYRHHIAEEAIRAGADIINDISAGEFDTEILAVAARNKTPYIAMHMLGRPATMQHDPVYENVRQEVFDFFGQKVEACRLAGLTDLILDPGFGFGKTLAHNYELLAGLKVFQEYGKPLLAGISRKSMICKVLHINPEQALNGSTALHMLALMNGAVILRVHDVKEAMECIKLYENYRPFAE